MKAWHIHISGIVQGVGFRPLVYRLATAMDLKGYVCNAGDGLHIHLDADKQQARRLYTQVLQSPPKHALITQHTFEATQREGCTDFSIRDSNSNTTTDLLLTPDIAMCDDCRAEIIDVNNPRHHYSFTTCLQCGPRYSIVQQMPYDREHTTMAHLPMCAHCNAEYNDARDRRHFSQTNSCPDCAINLHLYDSSRSEIKAGQSDIPFIVASLLVSGGIIAIKGVGGYLLLCNATDEAVVRRLRQRKHRPLKPLAVMFENITAAKASVHLTNVEKQALLSPAAPIVLCAFREEEENKLCRQQLAPGLDKLGVMLPYSPLLLLVSLGAGIPLVATSANFSGSPVIYKDDDALSLLGEIADYVLTYDRQIAMPQDDSVMQFTKDGQKIILRRSRGLAPNYYPNPFKNADKIIATGADLKSSFAMHCGKNIFISQFLGDQSALESQESYEACFRQLAAALQFEPARLLADAHPGYYSTAFAALLAQEKRIPLQQVQHHRAHFAAVLAENDLLHHEESVLGFTWDGTGYGDDQQVWGGETFLWKDGDMDRIFHLSPFTQISGDKMSKEPRLSALSMLHHAQLPAETLHDYFSDAEWQYFQKQLQHPGVFTSSMGRLIDGAAALLGVCIHNRYEGNAAMFLEVAARQGLHQTTQAYHFIIEQQEIRWQPVVKAMIEEQQQGVSHKIIAAKFLRSLVKLIKELSDITGVPSIACSGGVFQNALLVEMMTDEFSDSKKLYLHQQLSPNDECISFGQLAWYELQRIYINKNINQLTNEAICV